MPYDFSRLNALDDQDLQPQMPQYQAPRGAQPGMPNREITRQEAEKGGRQMRERYLEQQAGKGPLGFLTKPLMQLSHTLASPDMASGRLVADPINAISRFGNWLGDKAQGRTGDVSDAWQLPNGVRNFAPMRAYMGNDVTEADRAADGLAGTVMPQIAAHVLGYGMINSLGRGVQALGAVRTLAATAKTSPALARVLNIGGAVTGELGVNALALPFMNPQNGNLANVGDALGWNLPGRVLPTDTYGEALGKTFAVEGLAAPLAVIGGLSLLKPFRRELTAGSRDFWNTTFWQTMADQGVLEQYVPGSVGPLPRPTPLLPSGTAPASAPQLPGYTPGGALALPTPDVPWGSAIERNLSEATQIKQVQEQRQRLQDAGLLERGPNQQLELSVGAAVDPEIRLQIRELQMQRGQTIRQMQENPEQASALEAQLTDIDKEIADLTLSGSTDQFLSPPTRQGEFDLTVDEKPDTRPEIDTFLAHLDELDDQTLREIHSRVWRDAGVERNAQELAQAQAVVEQVNQRIAEIQAKAASGEITPVGAKRMLTKAQKELALAQQQVKAIEGRQRLPESLVGDQLEVNISQQLGLDLSQAPELPTFQEMTRGASEFGYRTSDDYRSALQGWSRDLLRRLAMPDSSPEVAALVKARTGRRVWQAKKADIIDALVEISERRGRYLPPEPEQLSMPLTANAAGVDNAPLLDVPANLDVPGMGRTLDADGNEVSVPMVDYQARGMDPATRERLRMEVLSKAIQNGEVQAPISPIPQRPLPPEYLDQASFIDDLFSDPNGQLPLQFANDQLPIYEAGGKNAAALIDEMRLRFQYVRLDNEAAQAQKEAFMAAHGWDTLSWDDKKKLGILGKGMFAFNKDDLIKHGTDVVRPATPQFNPELPVKEGPLPPSRPPAAQPDGVMLVNRDGVPTAEPVAAPKSKASQVEANAQAAAIKKAAKAADTADKQVVANASAARQELLKRRERLAQQAKGASC